MKRLGGAPRALELVAHYQANAAENAGVRDAMRGIAADETSHASLAWDVAAWLERRLSEDERRQLDRARDQALRELAVSVAHEPGPELTSGAAAPSAISSARPT